MASDRSKEPETTSEGSARTRPDAPALPEGYSADGVDLTLIRWMLTLTPSERLDVLQSAVRSLHDLRGLAAPR
jgi:hypothetical protein